MLPGSEVEFTCQSNGFRQSILQFLGTARCGRSRPFQLAHCAGLSVCGWLRPGAASGRHSLRCGPSGGPDGLCTSVWVFPLLGAMYAVVGGLQLFIDQSAFKSGYQSLDSSPALGAVSPDTSASSREQLQPVPPPASSSVSSWFSLASSPPRGSWLRLLSSMGVLISLLHFSSQLFEAHAIPSTGIFAILALCAHANWFAFDRTLPGYLLALFVAVGAPASEVLIMKYFGLWHYTKPDIFIAGEGMVSWTAWCYFFYTQWVATVARTLAASLTPNSPALDELKW
ncbi:unnamed protein product [Closterium sp. Yama58-4]|nr:unnamed protein product [Closterium sp. Yama58-4]